jgi:hypothetical protein
VAFDKGREREKELKEEEVQKIAAQHSIPVDVLTQALAAAMQQAMGNIQRPRVIVPFGQHSVKSAFNVKGKRERPVKYRIYQNGYWCNPRKLFDEEIALINSGKIKPGKYINGLVRVTIADEDTPEPAMHFTYKNERADQRMALGSLLTGPEKTGFARMLRLIVDERTAQDVQAKVNRRKQIQEDLADDDPLSEVTNDTSDE